MLTLFCFFLNYVEKCTLEIHYIDIFSIFARKINALTITIMKKLAVLLFVISLTSCGYKKSVGGKVYIQYVGSSGPRITVAHSRPDCPDIDSYREVSLKNCYAMTVCAKCVKEEDAHKILKE